MYSAELERHKREKEEWKRKAERLEDQASALQVSGSDPIGDMWFPSAQSDVWLCYLLAQPGRGQRCSGIGLPPHRPAGPAGGADGGSEETR